MLCLEPRASSPHTNPKRQRGEQRPSLTLRVSVRPAYTLLEILLASAISLLLVGALYLAVNVQLRHAQIGREVAEESMLSRALLARIASDIRLSLGPIPAGAFNPSSGSTGSSPSGSGSGSASSGTSSATPATGAASSSSPTSATATGTGAVQCNLGVQGAPDRLILSISRIPRELYFTPGADNGAQPLVSDLRRVTYWLAGDSGAPLGLARQEVKLVTSDDATAVVPPDVPDATSFVIAEEVKSLAFRYFDGSAWQDNWDGTAAGADGRTPLGPPLAIAITLGMASPGSGSGRENEQAVKSYRHVVAIPTANGASQANTSGTTSP